MIEASYSASKCERPGLFPPDLHVPPLQDLVAGVVPGLKQDPVCVLAHARFGQIPHVYAVEERARAINGGAAVDAGAFVVIAADDGLHLD